MQHTLGWPLDNRTGGGSFLYHYGANLVSVGFVVHLNYANPYLSPYGEFQRFKTHPAIRDTFEGGKRIAYGARAITEGGWQSIPKLAFPGGVLVGCAAGFMNVPRIKGSHNAMLSGIAAAEAAFAAIGAGRAHDRLEAYAATCCRVRSRATCGACAMPSRCCRGSARVLGTVAVGRRHVAQHADAGHRPRLHAEARQARLRGARRAAQSARRIDYPKPDGVLTFDRLTNVSFSGHQSRGGPAGPPQGGRHGPAEAVRARRVCRARLTAIARPASTSGWRKAGGPRYVINAQNCVHCKTCDIKDPNQNINWVVPEGGGGPNYSGM